jgi:threonylcarbamoyladenosine tRNA methylthiotransferase MtaB
VITGFPGENGSDFLDTFSFLERMPLSYLHIFSYSERPGTVSSELPGKVTPEEKDQRSKKLIRLAAEKSTGFHKINIGQKENVLFEKPENKGMITGFTGNYLKVEFQWDQTLTGRVVPVLLTGIAPSGNMTIEITGQ